MAEIVEISNEKFTVLERLLLLNGILPAQGDVASIRILRRFREELSFSEQEQRDLRLRQEDNQTRWDNQNEPVKSIQFGPRIRELIVQGLKESSAKKQLTEQHLDLYDRFIPSEGERTA
jgi:hypothetical protein